MSKEALIEEVLAESRTQASNLCEFFESQLPLLRRIRLRDVPLRVLGDVALFIHNNRPQETDWIAFLNKLGIVENRAIIFIKLKSKMKEELPIYFALTGPLFERLTFGDIVEAILKFQRLDALHEIRKFVDSLLESTQSHSYFARRPTAPEAEDVEKEEFNEMRYEKFQKSHLDMDDKAETITVLILHADADINVAVRLGCWLKKAGIVAKTLSNFDHLLMMNSFEVIPALLSAVDFIVPIVSESFLNQIHSGNITLMNAFANIEPSEVNASDYEDHFSHNSNNRYIYQLILSQYVRNRCLNFNVRPVMVPHFDWNLLTHESLLKQSYRLWEKVLDFIEMLNKTKQLFNRKASRRTNFEDIVANELHF